MPTTTTTGIMVTSCSIPGTSHLAASSSSATTSQRLRRAHPCKRQRPRELPPRCAPFLAHRTWRPHRRPRLRHVAHGAHNLRADNNDCGDHIVSHPWHVAPGDLAIGNSHVTAPTARTTCAQRRRGLPPRRTLSLARRLWRPRHPSRPRQDACCSNSSAGGIARAEDAARANAADTALSGKTTPPTSR